MTHPLTDEMPEIKACFDCKYCCSQEDAKENHGGWFVCLHPRLGKPNFLTGTLRPTLAVEHRKKGQCGFDAKYWEAK